MLNDVQKMTIRVAVGKAVDKDAEIKKLSVGFKVPESEIRTYWEGVSEGVPAATNSPKPVPASKLHGSKKGRIFWTDDMIQQLDELNKLGNTAPQIAKVMGLEVKQVINKLHRRPDPRAAAPSPPAPAEPASEPKSDKPIPADRQKSTRVPAAPQDEMSRSVSLPNQVAQVSDQFAQIKENIRKVFAPFSVPARDTEEPGDGEVETSDYPLDMPAALFRMAKLVHDNFSDNVIRIYASNDDHCAACAFEVSGVTYDLRLEVLE
jgi:hypothetical protein